MRMDLFCLLHFKVRQGYPMARPTPAYVGAADLKAADEL